MPETHQAIVARAFNLLWGRICKRRAATADVELDSIEHEMTSILLDLGSREGDAEEQWILAQLLLGPRTLLQLKRGWAASKRPTPGDQEQLRRFLADRDHREWCAHQAIAAAVSRLVGASRVYWNEGQLRLQ